jgi:hypothetical protein
MPIVLNTGSAADPSRITEVRTGSGARRLASLQAGRGLASMLGVLSHLGELERNAFPPGGLRRSTLAQSASICSL